MKMAALQLMQQKANKDIKTDVPAITAEAASENSADAAQTQTPASDPPTETEASSTTDGPVQTDSPAAQQPETDGDSSKPATNGPLDLTATQNGECKSPLEGKELEESIPGLAQAKELAETLVAEDGSCIGMSQKSPPTPKKGLDEAGRATVVANVEVVFNSSCLDSADGRKVELGSVLCPPD